MTKEIVVACAAISKTIGGRCRQPKNPESKKGACTKHSKSPDLVTMADNIPRKVLIRFTLPTALNDEAADHQIRFAGSDPVEDSVGFKNAMGEAVADKLGRDFWAYRPHRGDTGSLVFNPGVPAVDIAGIWDELAAAGYTVVEMHRKQRPMGKPGSVLTVQCYPQMYITWKYHVPEQIRRFADRLCELRWGSCNIFSNEFNPQKHGFTETVNLSSPDSLACKHKLRWANGLWDYESLVVTQTAAEETSPEVPPAA